MNKMKNKKNSQLEASALRCPLILSLTVKEGSDARPVVIKDEDLKVAQAITTVENCVCWILDLQDVGALLLAMTLRPHEPYDEFKRNGLRLNAAPIMGIATEFEYLRVFLKEMGDECLPPPPLGFHYVVVMTLDSRVVVLQRSAAGKKELN